MDNELSKAIKSKLDAQMRMKEMDKAPSIFEGATGSVTIIDPSQYETPIVAGENVSIGTSGGAKVINAVVPVRELAQGDGIQIEEGPDGTFTIDAVNTDAASILGKDVDIPSFLGKDGYILAYNEVTGKFYLKVDDGEGGGGETSNYGCLPYPVAAVGYSALVEFDWIEVLPISYSALVVAYDTGIIIT